MTGGRRGRPFGAYFGDIGQKGYVEEEYFVSGQAVGFAPVGDLTADGRWTVEPTAAAPYKTRLLVRRPLDPAVFNGTVVVEWTNVSFGFDVTFVDTPGLYEGFAYVAVSAQRVGLAGYPNNPQGLTQWDPERYGGLSIPGDALSYDIFTQAGGLLRSARKPNGPDPLAGLRVRKLIATGASQSGSRLLSYMNAVQPGEGVFDALLPIICAGASAPFADPPPTAPANRSRPILFTRVRDDLTAPVLALNTETEALYYFPWRQSDSPRFRYWEIAGASHGPTGQVAMIRRKTHRDGVTGPWDGWTNMSNVMWSPTADAAIRRLHAWVTRGEPPPRQRAIDILGDQPVISRDAHGNALGGVRLPELEAPVARYAGLGDAGALSGHTTPFAPETLRALYPSHEAYVEQVRAAAVAAKRAGVILPYRVRDYVTAAEAASVPPA